MTTADSVLSDAFNYLYRMGGDAGAFHGTVSQMATSLSAHFKRTKHLAGYDTTGLDAVAAGTIKTAAALNPRERA